MTAMMTNTEWAALPRAMRDKRARLFYEMASGIVSAQARQFLLNRPARSREAAVFLANCRESLRVGIGHFGDHAPPMFLAVDMREPSKPDILLQVPLYAHDCDECRYLGSIKFLTSFDIDPNLDVLAVLSEHDEMRMQLENWRATDSGSPGARDEAWATERLLQQIKSRVPEPFDAYICRKAGYETLILRNSDEPSGYETLPIGLHPRHEFSGAYPAFHVAMERMELVGR